MPELQKYLTFAETNNMDHAIAISTAQVYTAPWVRMKCLFGCPGYGRSLCCPPKTPTPADTEKLLQSYSEAILLHRHWNKGYSIVEEFNAFVVELERTLFLDGFYKAFGMGSGPCKQCSECDPSGLCRNPSLARPAMEACGIDVFKTAREQGLPIHVVRDRSDERDVYGLILVE